MMFVSVEDPPSIKAKAKAKAKNWNWNWNGIGTKIREEIPNVI